MISSRWGSLVLLVAMAALLVNCSSSSTTQNPTPVITTIFPQTITAGSDTFNIDVTGFGATFISTSVGLWNGSPRTTTFNSSTGHLLITILAADVSNPSLGLVSVMNPSPGGGFATQPASFQVLVLQNSAPTDISLDPSNATAGTKGPFMLTVNGTNFAEGAIVRVNGAFRLPSSVTPTAVTADLSTTDLATAGFASISVENPLPGGAVASSISVDFTINSSKGANSPFPLNARSEAPFTVTPEK